MNFRNISAWSIRNPVVPLVIFVGLMLMGIVAFSRMKIQDMPDVEFPAVIVTIAQPGAAPVEIETQVTQKVEAAIRTISDIDSISSTAQEGSSTTTVLFNLGTDVNVAVSEVKNQIDQIRGDLPDGILEPRVVRIVGNSSSIAAFTVSADDMSVSDLSWFVDDTVTRRLLGVPGMASVTRTGGVSREIRVTLDPARMQSLGVTASQVNAVLRQLNINAAGGKAEIAGVRQSVRVLGNARTAFELSQTEVPLGNGRTVKLADFAHVSDSFAEVSTAGKVNGRQVVLVEIARARGASDVSVYDGAVAELRRMEKDYPGLRFQQVYSSVDYTRMQYETSMWSMVEGAILAVVVVFLFLRDWRATFIAAIAIPLSAVPTFWFLHSWFGFTLNGLSLMALGLVAGLLVDDAIVEIENIVRHMRMGKTAYQAAIDAADEIGLAVVATTFSIAAVFLPVGLMGGISGQFFRNFGLTVVVAVLLSLAVARMITPMIAAYFLAAKGHAEHAGGRWMAGYLRLLRWSLDDSAVHVARAAAAAERRPQTWGERIAARLRDHRVWMIGVGVLALLLTGLAGHFVPIQLIPPANANFALLSIETTPGTTLDQTTAIADKAVAMLRADPDVASAFERIGETNAHIFINLRHDRRKSSQEFQRLMTPRLQTIADARIAFQEFGPGSGAGDGGTGRPISMMFTGSDSRALNAAASTLAEQMRQVPGLVAPRVAADIGRPEILIRPRLALAAGLGVTTSALGQAIRVATIGDIDQNAARFSLSDRQVPIRVRLSEDARRNLSTIQNLPVPTANGGSVPLSTVADISFGSGPTTIQRYNQSRRVFVGADLAPGVVKGTAMDAIMKLPIMQHLPAGVAYTPFGQDKIQNEISANFGGALGAGVLLVFSVLVLLYHRFVSPLVNLGSLFLAPLGGLVALLIVGQPFSMPVYIGILMLFGIVAKNSILLIDFAIEEMAKGTDKAAAIIEAGHKRAQPILMTTVAMIAGMVPTALSLSGDSAWRAPMGTVVIGGLALSTVLTLLIVPPAFSLTDGFEKRIGPMLRRLLLTSEPHHAGSAGAQAAE